MTRMSSKKFRRFHLLLLPIGSYLIIGCYGNVKPISSPASSSATLFSTQTSLPTQTNIWSPTSPAITTVEPIPTDWPTLRPIWFPTQDPLQTPEPTITAPPTRYPSLVLPEGWHIEEFPRSGSGNILQRHWHELGGEYYRPLQRVLDFGSKKLRLDTFLTDRPDNPHDICYATMYTQIFLEKEEIFRVENGKVIGCFAPIVDFWTYEQHWALEVSRCPGEDIHKLHCFDEVILDGESQNQANGYDSTFGFQLIDNKPFYFYKQNSQFGFSYNQIDYPLNYTDIGYANCCGATENNPKEFLNGVGFEAEYKEEPYFVVLGLIRSP